jgi:hypothetical protein
MPVIKTKRMRQEDHKFKPKLGYTFGLEKWLKQ